ncbi:hypothetical protein [Streptomyces sp. NPDC056982]
MQRHLHYVTLEAAKVYSPLPQTEPTPLLDLLNASSRNGTPGR